jgi:GT2 family glycosyltransferase
MTIKVYSSPNPNKDIRTLANGITQVVHNLARVMRALGFIYVDDPNSADIVVRHAAAQGGPRCDVYHSHGILPTAMFPGATPDGLRVNWMMFDNILRAKQVTVSSEWVADILRRDMRFSPHIVPWGINPNEWEPGENQGYVLWGKQRMVGVCRTDWANALAARAPDIQFVTTFGEKQNNVAVIGEQPFERMKPYLRHAGAYLATTRETFGIQTLEAMACGVPILGWRWAATADIVEHGVTGYLAEPNDMDDLYAGLRYVQHNRDRLGEAAREVAMTYTWERVAELLGPIYRATLEAHSGPLVSIIIPCYNYANWVADAIRGALRQTDAGCEIEVIVINDASTDNSAEVIDQFGDWARIVHKSQNQGVSAARNDGAKLARGQYIAFLDADDSLEHGWLKACLSAMRANDRCGIAYTPIKILYANGNYDRWGWPPTTPMPLHQLQGMNTVPTCCLIRREAFIRAGGYRKRFEPTEDGELWTKIVELGYDIVCASVKPLFIYRTGHDSLSRGKQLPAYMDYHLPSKHGTPPMAAPSDGSRRTWPARDYDRPVISVWIRTNGCETAELIETLDSIVAQTFLFWELCVSGDFDTSLLRWGYPFIRIVEDWRECRAPLLTWVDGGDILDPFFFEGAVRAWQETGEAKGVIPMAWLAAIDGISVKETLQDVITRMEDCFGWDADRVAVVDAGAAQLVE